MARSDSEQAHMEAAVAEAFMKINRAAGDSLSGGYRVQVNEALVALFEAGEVAGSWKPQGVPEATGAPRTTSEALGRPQIARGALQAPDGARMPSGGYDSWSELRGWWEQTAHDEIGGLIAKMEEYGGAQRATDLTDIGRAMVDAGVMSLGGLDGGPQEVQEQWHQELGAYFYLRGKFARWSAAIKEGRPVSDDTLHDIAIYTRMVQRIRAVGGWPV